MGTATDHRHHDTGFTILQHRAADEPAAIPVAEPLVIQLHLENAALVRTGQMSGRSSAVSGIPPSISGVAFSAACVSASENPSAIRSSAYRHFPTPRNDASLRSFSRLAGSQMNSSVDALDARLARIGVYARHRRRPAPDQFLA